MNLDSFLKCFGLRSKSLAERVNDRIVSGYVPSEMARTVVGKVSSRKFNEMMVKVSDEYNAGSVVKVFKDE